MNVFSDFPYYHEDMYRVGTLEQQEIRSVLAHGGALNLNQWLYALRMRNELPDLKRHYSPRTCMLEVLRCAIEKIATTPFQQSEHIRSIALFLINTFAVVPDTDQFQKMVINACSSPVEVSVAAAILYLVRYSQHVENQGDTVCFRASIVDVPRLHEPTSHIFSSPEFCTFYLQCLDIFLSQKEGILEAVCQSLLEECAAFLNTLSGGLLPPLSEYLASRVRKALEEHEGQVVDHLPVEEFFALSKSVLSRGDTSWVEPYLLVSSYLIQHTPFVLDSWSTILWHTATVCTHPRVVHVINSDQRREMLSCFLKAVTDTKPIIPSFVFNVPPLPNPVTSSIERIVFYVDSMMVLQPIEEGVRIKIGRFLRGLIRGVYIRSKEEYSKNQTLARRHIYQKQLYIATYLKHIVKIVNSSSFFDNSEFKVAINIDYAKTLEEFKNKTQPLIHNILMKKIRKSSLLRSQ